MTNENPNVRASPETVGRAVGRMAIGMGIAVAGLSLGIGIATGFYYVGKGLEISGSRQQQSESLLNTDSERPKKPSS